MVMVKRSRTPAPLNLNKGLDTVLFAKSVGGDKEECQGKCQNNGQIAQNLVKTRSVLQL